MEKLVLMLVLPCQMAGQETRHIVTTDSGNGDWFQSTGIRIIGSNQLVFEAMGSRDAILGLCTKDTDASIIWKIVLGGHGNTWDSLRLQIQLSGSQDCQRSSLNLSKYRTFWLSWDQSSIRLGDGDIVGDYQSCELIISTETKLPTDFYLRLGSWRQNTINWIIHLPTATPLTTPPSEMLLSTTDGQQVRHIVITGSGSGNWFRSTGIRIIGSNQLVFQVKGSRDAIIGLATHDTDVSRRWDVVLGGYGNTWDLLRVMIENQPPGNRGCPRSSLSPTEYRTFWLSWNESTIILGVGDIVGQNQTCEQSSTDTNTPTDFYLRPGSWKQNTINWIIHLPTTTATTTETASTVTTEVPTTVTTTTETATTEAPTTVTTEAPTAVTIEAQTIVTTEVPAITATEAPTTVTTEATTTVTTEALTLVTTEAPTTVTTEAPTTTTTTTEAPTIVTTEAPTTVTLLPSEALAYPKMGNVVSCSTNVMSYRPCQMAVLVLRLVIEYFEF